MAKNVRLKNSDGVVIYPQTKSENIIDKDNLISANVIHDLIEGDEFITADLNEAGTKVKVSLDTDYQPHVVELSGTSGTLTDEQYLVLCGDTSSYTAQILLENEFYTSASEETDVDKYSHVNINDGIELKVITITKATKAWELETAISPASWHGTQAEYDAIETKDSNTLYIIVES